MYDYDSNTILPDQIKNTSERNQIWYNQSLQTYLQYFSFHPKLYITDNKRPREVKNNILNNNINFQLVTPNLHQTNAPKKEIGKLKNYCIYSICSAYPKFKMHLTVSPTSLPWVTMISPISQAVKMSLEPNLFPPSELIANTLEQPPRVIPPGDDSISETYHTCLKNIFSLNLRGHGHTSYD